MHSFHQSRGRILFEALCALGISASLVGAWLQTDASALLPAAALSLVYALVRISDMARRVRENAVDVPEEHPSDVPMPWDVDQASVSEAVEPLEPVKAAPAKPKAIRPRKSAARRPKSANAPSVGEPAVLEEPVAVEAPSPEPEPEEPTPIPLEPLFEPQPFARQQHAVFGRKSRFG